MIEPDSPQSKMNHLSTQRYFAGELADAAREEFCLTDEQVAEHLIGTPLPDLLNHHLSFCADCQLAVQEMREIQQSLSPIPVTDSAAAPIKTTPSVWQRWKDLNAELKASLNWRPVCVGAIVLAMAFIGIWIWRLRQPESPANIVALQPSPSLSSPPIRVVLNDASGPITLDEQGVLSGVGNLPESDLLAVKNALQNQRLEISAASSELNGSSKALMGKGQSQKEFRVLSPLGKVLRTVQPEFRWNPLDGAANYTVTIYDSAFRELAVSPQLTTTFWKTEKSLPRGRILFWQVRAVKEGQEQVTPSLAEAPAKFKVIDKQLNDKLEQVERSGVRSNLVLGILYAQAGLKEEAAIRFRALVKANPDSALARKFMDSVMNGH